jgi:RNA polymerase sigma-70 factor, ECF subfamily
MRMSHTLTEEGNCAEKVQESLGDIYRENVNYVWRALSHLGVAPPDVADVAQDVFITVQRRLNSFEGRSTIRTWIYGICLRTVSDYRSRAFRRREIPQEQLPEQESEADQQQSLQEQRLRSRLIILLDSLKPEQRDVFVLYEIEELTMREVAAAVDCPLQTAYSRLHAAREQLRTKLQQEGYSP